MSVSLSKIMQRPALWPWLLLSPIAIYMTVMFLIPLGDVAVMSITEGRGGIDNYTRALTSPLYQRTFLNTFATAGMVTLFCLIVGFPLAYLMSVCSKRTAMLILLLITMSFWTSFLVRTFAWMVILGNNGPFVWLAGAVGWTDPPRLLFTRFASTLAMVQMLAPYMIMNIYTVMQKIDPALVRSAQSMGARGASLFRHVYLPLSAPGIANGCVLVFVICLGFYVTPVLLGSPREQMIAGLIGTQIDEFLNFGLGSALAMILLAVTMVILAIYHRRFGLDKLWG
ncbi:ABC transporter permease [Gemmobacter sp.]|uniref:ABC transporter permease n=1 Tax=Gemmobacter sp. TaxID=1898957 RepID=UPI002AFE794D|nr:ABC transporter permease [Gemmobacter sp.]